MLKNWSFQIVVLEKTHESPLDFKEIKPINPKGNQCWVFIGRTDAEAPTLWSPDVKSSLTGKDPDWGLGKIEDKRRGQQRMRWLNSITNSMDMNLSKLWEKQWRTEEPGVLQPMGSQRVGHDLGTEQYKCLINVCGMYSGFKSYHFFSTVSQRQVLLFLCDRRKIWSTKRSENMCDISQHPRETEYQTYLI